jgi:hypothetical protein
MIRSGVTAAAEALICVSSELNLEFEGWDLSGDSSLQPFDLSELYKQFAKKRPAEMPAFQSMKTSIVALQLR